jgi:pilus assembly protein CpaF
MQTAARTVFDAVAGFGLLQRHLDDPTIEEVWINERLTAGFGAGGRFV